MHASPHVVALSPHSGLERVQVNAVHHHSHHHHHHGLQRLQHAVSPPSHLAAIVHQPHFVLAAPQVASVVSSTSPTTMAGSLPPPPSSSSFTSRPTFSRPPPPIQSVLPQPQQPQQLVPRWTPNSSTIVSVDNASNESTQGDENKAKSVAVKQKTPMCLVNELARYNRIRPEYRLLGESGPAHSKSFSISLKLSEDEDFLALGPSIKKAQHAAAAIALEKTKLKHPPIKEKQARGVMTPTVELNALAMKRGEQASYTFVELSPKNNSQSMSSHLGPQQSYLRSQMASDESKRGTAYFSESPAYTVLLRVGNRAFYGEGQSPQKAKHDAAAKAITAIKTEEVMANGTEVSGSKQNVSLNPASLPFIPSAKTLAAASIASKASSNHGVILKDSLKSPISLVHELALKRRLECNFSVVKESGAAHMRNFTTKCIVGDIVTQGEGNGKRASKRQAAELMLECLSKLPPLASLSSSTSSSRASRRRASSSRGTRRRTRGSQQVVRPEDEQLLIDNSEDMNPISKLIQLQQAKRAKEPVYTLTVEKGTPRRKEYTIQVEVEGFKASGTGPNKKLAKRAAADALLNTMGYTTKVMPAPDKAAIVKNSSHVNQDQNTSAETKKYSSKSGRKLKFEDEVRSERRVVPIVSANGITESHSERKKDRLNNGHSFCNNSAQNESHVIFKKTQTKKCIPVVSAALPLDYDDDDESGKIKNSPIANGEDIEENTSNGFVSAKNQLEYLAKVLHVTLKFQEFLKKGEQRDEVFCLLSISTKPPQVFHGMGTTSEESQELASEAALQALAGSGINCVEKPRNAEKPRFTHSDDGNEDDTKTNNDKSRGKKRVLIAKVASTSRTHSQI